MQNNIGQIHRTRTSSLQTLFYNKNDLEMTLTPEPLRGDVLQQSKWDAEERYQKVADG